MVMERKEVLKKKMNSMSDNNKDLLGEYDEQPEKPAQQLPTLIKPKKDYQAIGKFKTAEKIPHFRIYDRNGNFDRYSYSHLLEVSFREGVFIIMTTTRIFTLSGKNLGKIADSFDERKVKALYEFNPDKHTPPTEQNAILIENIERAE